MRYRPIFHPHITVHVLDSDKVLLSMEEEGEERLLTGPSCGLVARSIDGTLTTDEIVGRLADQVSPELIYFALQRFESGGYFTDVQPLRKAAVSLIALGGTELAELTGILSRLDIGISADGPFRIVLTDDYLHGDLRQINLEAIASKTAWILAKPIGRTQWLGPIFRPGITGCWMCLSHRLRANRLASSSIESKVSRAGLPSAVSAALNLLAGEVAKWLATGRNETLEGAVWTIDSSLATRFHPLTRRSQCPACGNSERVNESGTRISLQERLRTTGNRTVSPEETVRTLERHVSPITGIVPIIRRVTTNVYVALHGRSGVAGKGVTDSEAKAACLGEAIERYSSSYQGDEMRVTARLADLSNAVSPAALLHFSERQYHERETWNKQHGAFQWVPERFDDASKVNWSPVWSLTCQQTRYVPTGYCYLRYPLEDRQFFRADSNGCASGNTLEEAVLQGLLELIERDSFALWWYSRAKRPRVDLDGLQERFWANGRTAHVLDITNDLGIPAFVAVSPGQGAREIVFGSGADLDPRIAVRRALCELNQMLETVLVPGERDSDVQRWLQSEVIDNHEYLLPHGDSLRSKSLSQSDILQDINTCIEILRQRDMEVLVLDMTRPDIGFPVVRVVVPGLRHFWARLGAGRLFDVPVELGWIPKRLQEHELNPIPYML